VLTSRSQIAFMRGAWTAVRKILVPAAWKTASKGAVKFDPRSGSLPYPPSRTPESSPDNDLVRDRTLGA
jgi:hypothetical protein